MVGTVRILGTSREALRATGEWVYRLPSLTLAPINERPGAIEALAYSAVDLFVQAVRARQDRFELHDNDVHTVLEICRQLDGIPLAIEFAASRVAEVGLKEVASRLGDRFSILTRGRRTALPRHQTLEATLRWSYDLLPVGEQTLLRQLSTFRGPFTAEAAAALAFDGRPEDRSCHATWEQLSNLFDKSLVTADVGDDTLLYRLLDTTRAYAYEKLVESGEAEMIVRRHALYMREALREAERTWQNEDAVSWLGRYSHLVADLRGAIEWAMSPTGDRTLGIQLTAASSPLRFALSLIKEYGQMIDQALAVIVDTGMDDPVVEVRLWDAFGHSVWHMRGSMPEIALAFNEALESARQRKLQDGQLRALWRLPV